MPAGDLLAVVVDPVRLRLETLLAPHLAPPLVAGAGALLDATAIAVAGVLLARAGGTLLRTSEARGRAVVVLLAAGLLGWIATHPSLQLHELFLRADHLGFALLTGCVLTRTSPGVRPWLVSLLSAGLLCQYLGTLAVGVGLAAGLATFAAAISPVGRRASTAVAAQAAIGAVVYALCWRLRATDFFTALPVAGLFAFLFLRQISFAVAAYGGEAGSLGNYLCYLLFYPGITGLFGGPEVWSEFSRRNLRGRSLPEHARAQQQVVNGMVQNWIADRIPVSAEIVFASPTAAVAWMTSLLFFVKVALKGMGIWAMIDATASLYGFRLRPNFEGILRCRNPSDLWRSWRGTLTNWLVCHVYAPLGANRRHQSLNILAAFAVSLVWHWAGVPFLNPDFRLRQLVPITLWAGVNALAVVGHVQMTRHRWRLLPDAVPPRLRDGIHLFLTYCLGTFSVTLPSMQLGLQNALVPFLRRLAGLGG